MIKWKIKKYDKENIGNGCTKEKVTKPSWFLEESLLSHTDILAMSVRLHGNIDKYLERLEFGNMDG